MKLSLKTAFELLDKQNIDLVQARFDMLLAKQDVKDARNSLFPQVSIGASHNYNLGLAFDQIAGELVTGNKWSNTANANISLSTTIFQGFNRFHQIKSALLGVEGAMANYSVKKKVSELELLSHYFDALASFELYRAGEAQLKLSKEQYDLCKVEFDIGNKTLIDLSVTESQITSDQVRILTNKSNYDTKLMMLKEILQIPLQDSVILDTPDIEFVVLEENTLYGTREVPEVLQSKLLVERATLQLKTARNAYYPTISFSAGYGTNYSSERKDYVTGRYMLFTDQIDQNKSLYMGISLNIPVFDGFKIKGNINRAKVSLEQSKSALQKIIMSQDRIIRSAQQEYKNAIQEHTAYKMQLNATMVSYEAMKVRYALGMSSILDLSKTQLDYNLAELDLIRSKYLVIYGQEVLKVLFDSP